MLLRQYCLLSDLFSKVTVAIWTVRNKSDYIALFLKTYKQFFVDYNFRGHISCFLSVCNFSPPETFLIFSTNNVIRLSFAAYCFITLYKIQFFRYPKWMLLEYFCKICKVTLQVLFVTSSQVRTSQRGGGSGAVPKICNKSCCYL